MWLFWTKVEEYVARNNEQQILYYWRSIQLWYIIKYLKILYMLTIDALGRLLKMSGEKLSEKVISDPREWGQFRVILKKSIISKIKYSENSNVMTGKITGSCS